MRFRVKLECPRCGRIEETEDNGSFIRRALCEHCLLGEWHEVVELIVSREAVA